MTDDLIQATIDALDPRIWLTTDEVHAAVADDYTVSRTAVRTLLKDLESNGRAERRTSTVGRGGSGLQWRAIA